MLDLAYIYEVTDRAPEAEKTYLAILANDAVNVQALSRLGNLYMREDRGEEAIQQFDRLLQIAPQEEQTRLKIGIIHLQQKNYKAGAADFSALLKIHPKYDQALYYLGLAREGMQQYREALGSLGQIPPNSQMWDAAQPRMAMIYLKLKDFNKAAQVLNAAIAKCPEAGDLYLYLAMVYQNTNRNQEALQTLERGLRVLPDNPALLFRKGLQLRSKGHTPV
jgi:tetratricopeptide (TPR) repeat protein